MGLQTTYKGFTVYAEENPDRHRGGVAWSVCLHDEELDNGLCADWGQVLPDAAKSIDKLLEGKEEMNTPAQSVLTKSQTRTFERHDVTISGQKYRKIKAVVRFDDQCGNGHNTFSITGSAWEPRNFKENDPDTGGCIHELIAEAFPELAPLIKWHLVSTDGPMHYLANTTYLASDRDYNGLRAGETRQICNGRTGLLCWELAAIVDGEPRKARIDGVPNTIDAAEKPAPILRA